MKSNFKLNKSIDFRIKFNNNKFRNPDKFNRQIEILCTRLISKHNLQNMDIEIMLGNDYDDLATDKSTLVISFEQTNK